MNRNKALAECRAKLHPRINEFPPLTCAILAFMLNMNRGKWTEPMIGAIAITSDNFVISQPIDTETGGLLHSEFFGTADKLRELIDLVADFTGLTDDGRWLLHSLIPFNGGEVEQAGG